MRQGMLLMIVGMTFLAAAQSQKNFCSFSDPLFSVAKFNAPIDIQQFEAYTGSDRAEGNFLVVNRADRAITSIAILAEFRDQNDRYIMTIPFSVQLRDILAKPPFRSVQASILEGPLEIGQSTEVFGYVLETTARCPRRVIPTLVDITFSEGPNFHYAAAEWRMDPHVGRVSSLSLRDLPVSPPVEDAVDLQLDAHGGISLLSGPSNVPLLAKWLRAEIGALSFSPALHNGKPVPCGLKLLFRIQRTYDQRDVSSFNDEIFQKDTVVPIDIFAHNPGRDESILIGGVPFFPSQ